MKSQWFLPWFWVSKSHGNSSNLAWKGHHRFMNSIPFHAIFFSPQRLWWCWMEKSGKIFKQLVLFNCCWLINPSSYDFILSILTQSSHSPSFPPEPSKTISTVSPCCPNLSQQPQPYTGIDWYILVYIGIHWYVTHLTNLLRSCLE